VLYGKVWTVRRAFGAADKPKAFDVKRGKRRRNPRRPADQP
jgi:hypothetical protein